MPREKREVYFTPIERYMLLAAIDRYTSEMGAFNDRSRWLDLRAKVEGEVERRSKDRRQWQDPTKDYPGWRHHERRQNPPALVRCPQCGSMYCGPVACRFSWVKHTVAFPNDPDPMGE